MTSEKIDWKGNILYCLFIIFILQSVLYTLMISTVKGHIVKFFTFCELHTFSVAYSPFYCTIAF